MALRSFSKAWLVATALAACSVSVHALGYDPFTDTALIQPEDELEERLWDEAELLRAQFVRGKPSPAVEVMQRLVRGVHMKTWPELSRKVKIFVIDQADVMAFTSANGDIYLSTGMLLRLDSEKELQVILAREISHFTHRHTVRTVYAARLGAGAKVIASTALDAADFAAKVTTGISAMDLAKSVASLSQEMLITSGREILQDRLSRLKEMMADAFFRSMSVTGIGMVVKSSIFGFKDSLEEESDRYAMAFIEDKHGSTEAYRRVMQRLYDEAVLDEKKFSMFYANEDKLADRLKALTEFEATRDERRIHLPAALSVEAPVPVAEDAPVVAAAHAPEAPASAASAAAPAEATDPADPAGAVQTVPTAQAGELADVVSAPDVTISVGATEVAVVVVVDDAAPELSESVPSDATLAAPLLASTSTETTTATATTTVAIPVATTDAEVPYHQALQPLVMPLLETELEAGRYKRLMRNIERERDRVALPDRARAVLAESYAAMPEPAMQERGLSMAQDMLGRTPDDPRMLKLLGKVAYRKGQLHEAKDYLMRAMSHVPEGEDERGFIEQTVRQIEKKLSEAPK